MYAALIWLCNVSPKQAAVQYTNVKSYHSGAALPVVFRLSLFPHMLHIYKYAKPDLPIYQQKYTHCVRSSVYCSLGKYRILLFPTLNIYPSRSRALLGSNLKTQFLELILYFLVITLYQACKLTTIATMQHQEHTLSA